MVMRLSNPSTLSDDEAAGSLCYIIRWMSYSGNKALVTIIIKLVSIDHLLASASGLYCGPLCTKSISLHSFPRNFPVDGEAGNLL